MHTAALRQHSFLFPSSPSVSREQIKVITKRTLLCELYILNGRAVRRRNRLKAAQSGFDGRYWLVSAPKSSQLLQKTGRHVSLCTYSSIFLFLSGGRGEERQANYSEWFFYLSSSQTESFLFLLLCVSVNVPWAVWFLSASKYRLFPARNNCLFWCAECRRSCPASAPQDFFYLRTPLFSLWVVTLPSQRG